MIDSSTPASSSSSTLVSTTDTTSTQSPIHATVASKPKPGLNKTLLLLGPNSPKMSDRGFIEPHASHLPRRSKRERTKTGSLPSRDDQEQIEQQQQLERLRERLQLYQLETPPNAPPPPPPPPQVSTHPHKDNLPRRNRANTVPNNSNHTRTRRIPPPIPISIVDSQSTIGADATIPAQEAETGKEEEQTFSSLNSPPFKLNSKAMSLISKAQSKAFKSYVILENDNEDAEGDLDRPQISSSVPTSPQLPHPAMGLTMGIMEAYAAEEIDEGRVAHAIVRHGLSYSPALGVKGTPPPPLSPWTVLPVHSTRFVPVPASASIPVQASTPSPVLPPVSAPLGQNLPRRHHRCRQRSPHVGAGGEKKGKEVLRVVSVGRTKVGGNEDEDGLFSPLLDFERAGGARTGETSSNGVGFSLGGKRKRAEDERCIQVLGRSCVEVGYMLESEGKGDYVLVEATGQDEERRLELCLHNDAMVCKEGVPSLLPEQVRAGCEFMKGWIGSEEGTRRIRISVPRCRGPDAFGLAVCFLVWAEAQRGDVPVKVNDVACLEPEVYTPIHILYMGLLDDGEGEDERDWGKGKSVGLGILGLDVGIEEGEAEGGRSVHSDSTNTGSRPTLVRPAPSSSSVTVPSDKWTGLRDEWRGVLSYEGLNTLVGVWP